MGNNNLGNDLFARCKYTKEKLISIIQECYSFTETRKKLGYNDRHTVLLRKQVSLLNIDVSHFLSQKDFAVKNGIAKRGRYRNFTDEEMFRENSEASHSSVVKRMRIYRMLSPLCALCGQGDSYNGKKLTLQLDHKNGICNDHSVDNLRLLCPNCHSQTPTFNGRNKGNMPKNCKRRSYQLKRRVQLQNRIKFIP